MSVKPQCQIHGEALSGLLPKAGGHSCVIMLTASRRWIPNRPTAARSPWQNGYAERLIGSIRWDCLDKVMVLGERHLRHMLKSYQSYCNEARTHLSLSKDAPVSRPVQAVGAVVAKPLLGGLHHQYVRI